MTWKDIAFWFPFHLAVIRIGLLTVSIKPGALSGVEPSYNHKSVLTDTL